jgi:hypothetical protein
MDMIHAGNEEGTYIPAFQYLIYMVWVISIGYYHRDACPITNLCCLYLCLHSTCALALFYLADGDPVKSIIYGANFGRDADTIATMVGALAGAYKGVEGLKPEWVNKVKSNSPMQEELAQKLVNIFLLRRDDMKKSMDLVEGLM